ncbi:aspartate transaminase [Salvia divinorum]|uniref:Aspartate transaminase n=1 Tax=Salvia divinorum TaxID=28513 RepID=A0ABD1FLF9_SALDI
MMASSFVSSASASPVALLHPAKANPRLGASNLATFRGKNFIKAKPFSRTSMTVAVEVSSLTWVLVPIGLKIYSHMCLMLSRKKSYAGKGRKQRGPTAFNKATAELLFGAESVVLQQQRAREIKSSSCA